MRIGTIENKKQLNLKFSSPLSHLCQKFSNPRAYTAGALDGAVPPRGRWRKRVRAKSIKIHPEVYRLIL